MEPIVMIGTIAIFAGVLIAIGGLVKSKWIKTNLKIKTAMGAVIVGAIVAGSGAYFFHGIDGINELAGTAQISGGSSHTTVEEEAYQFAEFQITPSTVNTAGSYNPDTTLNAAKTVFSCPAMANRTASSYTLVTLANGTYYYPRFQFLVKPLAWAGATADDLATIYYKITNPDETITVSSSGSTYYICTMTGGNRQWIWSGDPGTSYVTGAHSMLLTNTSTIYLTCTLTQNSVARIENTYDPIVIGIEFYNAGSWSVSYDMSIFLTNYWTWA